ncbi:site-specific DNA-methyltransferase [Agrobacterium rhizogenes]|uniref:DNA-methyltransferase n=1 Tax=Rhizobium rhizogenes TaxID=359 RepID=UPI00157413ED|nr:site-specific DNA-methyltransferase [Rhizobium rhizogenes]NTG85843.1 site-specific DNA-methyltransferase [Rhizobium rhizogenes]
MATRLMIGDVREQLALLDADSVDCVVTSPPYWGLRDYGVAGQIGLEPTLAEHIAVMVQVFDLVKRVLKPTGTLWVNYGDCYATSPNGRSAAATKAAGNDDRTFRDKPFSTIQGVLKPKDLCMVPNRLAIALQEAGWWVRSEIIWGKTNPMPDSVKDRPGTAHEKIFLLTKSARYWYDSDAVRFGLRPKTLTTYGTVRTEIEDDGSGKVKKSNMSKSMPVRKPRGRDTYGRHTLGDALPDGEGRKIRASDLASPRHAGHINHTGIEKTPRGEGRNLRNYEPAPVDVWPIATKPFSEAHFATFPPELAERCILAGCPEGGYVLDPFGGAGTTALVAERHGRNAILIELNPEYADITRRRLLADGGMFASVQEAA